MFCGAQDDPLKKREEFAVSLRKKKKHELIQSKRKLLVQKREELQDID